DDLAIALERETNGVLHAVPRLVFDRRYPACAQRRVHFGDGVQRLCIALLIAGGIGITAVFGAVGVRRVGLAFVVARNDCQAQGLPDRRQDLRKARLLIENAARFGVWKRASPAWR